MQSFPQQRATRLPQLVGVQLRGLLFPHALLQRLAVQDEAVPGLEATSYGVSVDLAAGIEQSWNQLRLVWQSFRSGLERREGQRDYGASQADHAWHFALFRELGYTLLPWKTTPVRQGRTYPLTHRWEQIPIHLLPWETGLDEFERGQRRPDSVSPQGLLQEYLAVSGCRWAFLSNGRQLRLLGVDPHEGRPAFVEFDLVSIVDRPLPREFALLWLLCHRSRLQAERLEDCWLEHWRRSSLPEAVGALEHLRGRIRDALTLLGRGFLEHPANAALVSWLESGPGRDRHFFNQLLRLVWRLLFLFRAEEQNLLPLPTAAAEVRTRYLERYSATWLRWTAASERRREGDLQATELVSQDALHRKLSQVFDQLAGRSTTPPLGLPVLGGPLWAEPSAGTLRGCHLADSDLLAVVRTLSLATVGGEVRPVSYARLGPEALGNLLESLLDLQPRLDAAQAEFTLTGAGSSDLPVASRYNTPTPIIDALLERALEPVISAALREPDPEQALLNLRICDPACGCGNFLLAAGRRLAHHLARFRFGPFSPPEAAYRLALREVVSRCLYGVDRNPMAVDLCKLSLWLETLEPDQPLPFLEHRIRCGDSLLGATPLVLPSVATPLEAARGVEQLDALPSDLARYQFHLQWRQQPTLLAAQVQANDWCCARAGPGEPVPDFFHWHLAFPEVFAPGTGPGNPWAGWQGGFDVIITNPPWDQLRSPGRTAHRGLERTRLRPGRPHSRPGESLSPAAIHWLRTSGRYRFTDGPVLDSATLFLEAFRQWLRPGGRAACVVPAGVAFDSSTAPLLEELLQQRMLESYHELSNQDFLFTALEPLARFGLLTLCGPGQASPEGADIECAASSLKDIDNTDLHYHLKASDLALFTPLTRILPCFDSAQDAELARKLHESFPVLARYLEGPAESTRLRVDWYPPGQGDNRELARLGAEGWVWDGRQLRRGEEVALPIHDATSTPPWDTRWPTQRHDAWRQKLPAQQRGALVPRRWHFLASAAPEATPSWVLALFPGMGEDRRLWGHVLPPGEVERGWVVSAAGLPPTTLLCLHGNLLSLVVEYVVSQKSPGGLAPEELAQVPLLPPSTYGEPCPWVAQQTLAKWLCPRLLELLHTFPELHVLASACGQQTPPFPRTGPRRAQLLAEVDAAYFHLYGLDRDAVHHVLQVLDPGRRHGLEKVLECFEQLEGERG